MGVHPGIAEVDVAREPPSCFTSGEQPIGKRQLGQQLAATVRGGGVSWEIGRQKGMSII